MDLLEITITLMGERVPLGYDIREAKPECRKLGHEYIAGDEWAQSLGGTIESEADLDTLSLKMVEWVRSKGYPILDEPPSDHSPASPNRGVWAPLDTTG